MTQMKKKKYEGQEKEKEKEKKEKDENKMTMKKEKEGQEKEKNMMRNIKCSGCGKSLAARSKSLETSQSRKPVAVAAQRPLRQQQDRVTR